MQTHHLAGATRLTIVVALVVPVLASGSAFGGQDAMLGVSALVAIVLGSFLAHRLGRAGMTVTPDELVVHGVFRTQVVRTEDVIGVVAGGWHSFVELRGGRSIPTLLRVDDLPMHAISPTIPVYVLDRDAALG